MRPFLNDTSPMSLECISMITGLGNDEYGTYIVFDQSVFSPKDKRSPSDSGVVHVANHKIPVLYATKVNNEIRHYICSAIPLRIGQYALLKVNLNLRILYACIRDAAEILRNVVEYLYPNLKATNSSLYAGNSYIDYYCKEKINNVSINLIEVCANKALKADTIQSISARTTIPLMSTYQPNAMFGLMSRICVRHLKKSNKNIKLAFDVL